MEKPRNEARMPGNLMVLYTVGNQKTAVAVPRDTLTAARVVREQVADQGERDFLEFTFSAGAPQRIGPIAAPPDGAGNPADGAHARNDADRADRLLRRALDALGSDTPVLDLTVKAPLPNDLEA